jgi:RNA polymerase sigma factor (sigma-70 family)
MCPLWTNAELDARPAAEASKSPTSLATPPGLARACSSVLHNLWGPYGGRVYLSTSQVAISTTLRESAAESSAPPALRSHEEYFAAVQLHHGRLVKIAQKTAGKRGRALQDDDAADIVQNAMLKTVETVDDDGRLVWPYLTDGQLLKYLETSTRNATKDHFRDARSRRKTEKEWTAVEFPDAQARGTSLGARETDANDVEAPTLPTRKEDFNKAGQWAPKQTAPQPSGRRRVVANEKEADTVEQIDYQAAVAAALNALPPAVRAVVVGIVIEGQTQAAMAKRLGVSQSVISDRLTTGKAALRDLLSKDERIAEEARVAEADDNDSEVA